MLGLAVADQAEQQRLLDDLALSRGATDPRQTGQDIGEEAGGAPPLLLPRCEQGVADGDDRGAGGELGGALALVQEPGEPWQVAGRNEG